MIKNSEFYFHDEAQQLIDNFALCFKIQIRIFSTGMDELLTGLKASSCPFYPLIPKELPRPRCCRQAVLAWERRKPEFEAMVYHCYGGLAEAVVPIKLKGVLIGYALADHFRIRGELPESLLHLWTKSGAEYGPLIQTLSGYPFFDQDTLENILRLFSMLISFLVTREYIQIKQPGLAENAARWLESHIAEAPDLSRIAAAMKRSRSAISHSMKRRFGMSFKEFCILKRIQRFERIIAGNPEISIREAASLAGYRDPFYFSRLYKKVRAAAPSLYLKALRDREAAGGPGF
ncbi:MAG: PocR ligand-binding domain-containing protein [Treponema sp.]|jgi:AraC-like DNA-binding protein|nr:PocR ligand-binding domain-containing protein [Treponema sp.]